MRTDLFQWLWLLLAFPWSICSAPQDDFCTARPRPGLSIYFWGVRIALLSFFSPPVVGARRGPFLPGWPGSRVSVLDAGFPDNTEAMALTLPPQSLCTVLEHVFLLPRTGLALRLPPRSKVLFCPILSLGTVHFEGLKRVPSQGVTPVSPVATFGRPARRGFTISPPTRFLFL